MAGAGMGSVGNALLIMGAICGAGAVLAIIGLWQLIAWLAAHLTWS